MAIVTKLTGVDVVLRNLKKTTKVIGQDAANGLKVAGLFIQRESQLVAPVDTSNLKGGAFTRSFGKGFDTIVQVGYVAAYAVFVHENLDAKHAEGKQAKFLEGPVRENAKRILEIVREEAKL